MSISERSADCQAPPCLSLSLCETYTAANRPPWCARESGIAWASGTLLREKRWAFLLGSSSGAWLPEIHNESLSDRGPLRPLSLIATSWICGISMYARLGSRSLRFHMLGMRGRQQAPLSVGSCTRTQEVFINTDGQALRENRRMSNTKRVLGQ